MKQIKVKGWLKLLTFDSDGIYSFRDYTGETRLYWEASDVEIQTLKANIKKVTLPSIQDGDVIYFDKSAKFPKLLLSRLDLKAKRTVKIEKCNRLVVDDSILIDRADLDSLESGYLVLVGGTDEENYKQAFYISEQKISEIGENSNITIDLMQKYLPGIWKKVIVSTTKVNEESIELLNTYPEKITTVQQLAGYLNSQLPPLDDNCASSIISLFGASAEDKKLAINMVASCNISPILFDICEAIGKGVGSFDTSTSSSVNYKYFSALLGTSPKEILSKWKYGYWDRHKIAAKLFNRALMTPEQKYKAWKCFKDIAVNDRGYRVDLTPGSRYANFFEQYEMPLTYDSKRETDTSDREVETEQV